METLFDMFNHFIDGVSAGLLETDKTNNTNDVENYIPKNSYETAIEALASETYNTAWDATKLDYAKQIFQIIAVRWKDVPDSTKSYAIAQLKDISSRMTWDSNKIEVSKLIRKIAIGQVN